MCLHSAGAAGNIKTFSIEGITHTDDISCKALCSHNPIVRRASTKFKLQTRRLISQFGYCSSNHPEGPKPPAKVEADCYDNTEVWFIIIFGSLPTIRSVFQSMGSKTRATTSGYGSRTKTSQYSHSHDESWIELSGRDGQRRGVRAHYGNKPDFETRIVYTDPVESNRGRRFQKSGSEGEILAPGREDIMITKELTVTREGHWASSQETLVPWQRKRQSRRAWKRRETCNVGRWRKWDDNADVRLGMRHCRALAQRWRSVQPKLLQHGLTVHSPHTVTRRIPIIPAACAYYLLSSICCYWCPRSSIPPTFSRSEALHSRSWASALPALLG